MKAVSFPDQESAKVAFTLGEVAFRWVVCGGTHRSGRKDWQHCMEEIDRCGWTVRLGPLPSLLLSWFRPGHAFVESYLDPLAKRRKLFHRKGPPDPSLLALRPGSVDEELVAKWVKSLARALQEVSNRWENWRRIQVVVGGSVGSAPACSSRKRRSGRVGTSSRGPGAQHLGGKASHSLSGWVGRGGGYWKRTH